ncbi:MAG: VWA domain-containing protein [Acidobacteriota bacterium]
MSRALLAVLAVACLQPAGAGQEQPPVFRTEVAIVRLDVSVLDEHRRPIRGLTPDSFTILVDGIPQPIVAFSPVVVPSPEPPTAPWMREVAPDVRTNLLGEPRLFVIIMDDAVAPADPYVVENAKAIARSVVEHVGPGDLAAVVFTMNRRQSQDLTGDRTKLLQAIDRFDFGLGGPGMAFSKRTIKDTIGLLQEHQRSRTVLILIAGGGGDVSKGLPDPNSAEIEPWEVDALGRASRVGRLPIYYFSYRGLEAPGLVRGVFEWNDTKLRSDRLETLADESGGRAFIHTNAPADYVPAVFEENSAYYLIGYRPTYPLQDGRGRRLQIRVNRPGAVVFPDGQMVWSPKPSSRKPKPPPSPLFQAMVDLLPQSDIPLQVGAAPFAIPRTRRGATAAVAVTLRVRRPAPSEPVLEQVEALGKAFTVNGKEVASIRQTVSVRLVPAAADSEYELLSRLELKPGRYLLRYSVQSRGLDRTGSVYTEVTVPDFGRSPLSFSGLVLSAQPAAKAAPPDALASVMPVMPTTERTLTAMHRAQVFARLYQGGKRALRVVSLEAVLTDAHGNERVIQTNHLTAAQFAGSRAADCVVPLPLGELPPGPYLLTLRANAGNDTAKATVRFAVR